MGEIPRMLGKRRFINILGIHIPLCSSEIHVKERPCYVNNVDISKSSIAKNSNDSGCSFNFKNGKLIFNANNTSELHFLEDLAN